MRLKHIVGTSMGIFALGGFGILMYGFVKDDRITTSTSDTVPLAEQGRTFELSIPGSQRVTLPNFARRDQPEWAGENGYVVAGGIDESFLILYVPNPAQDGDASQVSFMVSLFQAPLSRTRLEASTALKVSTGLSERELCSMDVHVGDESVSGSSTQYSGPVDAAPEVEQANLGLSFCSNAVQLP